jgi:hypothetical protein
MRCPAEEDAHKQMIQRPLLDLYILLSHSCEAGITRLSFTPRQDDVLKSMLVRRARGAVPRGLSLGGEIHHIKCHIFLLNNSIQWNVIEIVSDKFLYIMLCIFVEAKWKIYFATILK